MKKLSNYHEVPSQVWNTKMFPETKEGKKAHQKEIIKMAVGASIRHRRDIKVTLPYDPWHNNGSK
tara:strand:- start:84 stop:278 length:195 start_codon:yes stop_codon:yes gene_type:complete